MEMPIQRHRDCSDDRCTKCLEDAQLLTDYLFERTGLVPRFHDILGEYRTWLDKNNIDAESRYGWPLAAVYAPKNVEGFIRHAIGED